MFVDDVPLNKAFKKGKAKNVSVPMVLKCVISQLCQCHIIYMYKVCYLHIYNDFRHLCDCCDSMYVETICMWCRFLAFNDKETREIYCFLCNKYNKRIVNELSLETHEDTNINENISITQNQISFTEAQ